MTIRRSILSIFILCLVISNQSFAQDDPPVRREECDDYTSTEYNDRLDCKTENVNTALYHLIDRAIEYDQVRTFYSRSSLFTKEERDDLFLVYDRVQNSKNRAHNARFYREAVGKIKPRDEECYIKEYSGDGDGVCEKNEECAEITTDGIGNDTQPCEQKGPKKEREVCVQICEQPLANDDENYDPESATDNASELEQLEVALTNAELGFEIKIVADTQFYKQRELVNAALSNSCGEFGPNSARWSFGVMMAMQVAKNLADGAFNVCSSAAGTTIVGMNSKAVCGVLAGVKSAADIIYDGSELGFKLDDEVDAAYQMAKMSECSQNLISEFDEPDGAIVILQKDVDLLTAEFGEGGAIDTLQKDVDKLKEALILVEGLLRTPQGKRDGFPDG
jgi:hypothetical protein